jgi:hypothetical protein
MIYQASVGRGYIRRESNHPHGVFFTNLDVIHCHGNRMRKQSVLRVYQACSLVERIVLAEDCGCAKPGQFATFLQPKLGRIFQGFHLESGT